MTTVLAVMMILINLFLFGWIAYLLGALRRYNDFYSTLSEELLEYEEHLDHVKDLITYYGDQDILRLLEHTKELKVSIESINGRNNQPQEESEES